MTLIKQTKSRINRANRLQLWAVLTLAVCGILSFAQGAMAHHPFGGETPSSFWQGFLSGMGHPVIGLDHLAFVVASGLIAAGVVGGVSIPVALVLATVAGTGIHLLEINLPLPELAIAASVVLFGGLIALKSTVNLRALVIAAIAALAGIFHGYAYGEAIVGAQMGPLVAYLLGFAVIQLGIGLAAYAVGNAIVKMANNLPIMRFLGLAISAIGLVFLASAITA